MEVQNKKIARGARVAIFMWVALFVAILVLNAVQRGWFRPQRHDWIFLSYEKAREVGRDDAKRELARGALGYEGGSGLPAPWMNEFIEILSADYHINYSAGGGCEPDPPGRAGYKSGYNEIMLPAIEARFGKGIFEKAASRAGKEYELKQGGATETVPTDFRGCGHLAAPERKHRCRVYEFHTGVIRHTRNPESARGVQTRAQARRANRRRRHVQGWAG